jgi:hypothetical protein
VCYSTTSKPSARHYLKTQKMTIIWTTIAMNIWKLTVFICGCCCHSGLWMPWCQSGRGTCSHQCLAEGPCCIMWAQTWPVPKTAWVPVTQVRKCVQGLTLLICYLCVVATVCWASVDASHEIWGCHTGAGWRCGGGQVVCVVIGGIVAPLFWEACSSRRISM